MDKLKDGDPRACCGTLGASGAKVDLEFIVRFGVCLWSRALVLLAHGDLLLIAVNSYHLMPGAHADGKGDAHVIGSDDQQLVAFDDLAAYVVGQAAIRVRDVVIALEHHDFGMLVQPPEPSRSRHPGGHTADDYRFHVECVSIRCCANPCYPMCATAG